MLNLNNFEYYLKLVENTKNNLSKGDTVKIKNIPEMSGKILYYDIDKNQYMVKFIDGSDAYFNITDIVKESNNIINFKKYFKQGSFSNTWYYLEFEKLNDKEFNKLANLLNFNEIDSNGERFFNGGQELSQYKEKTVLISGTTQIDNISDILHNSNIDLKLHKDFLKHVKTLENKFNISTSNALTNLEDIKKDILKDIKQINNDMENDPDIELEGGKVADSYGKLLNEKEKELAKINLRIEKIKNRVKSDTFKILKNNLDDINNSIKIYPDRTLEENAKIFKVRYSINDDLTNIVKELSKLI